jgi:hypothetical protein
VTSIILKYPNSITPIYNTNYNIIMSAMTQQRQQVYVSGEFSEPMSAQHNFANNFDLDNPDAAMSAYQRYVISHPLNLNHL